MQRGTDPNAIRYDGFKSSSKVAFPNDHANFALQASSQRASSTITDGRNPFRVPRIHQWGLAPAERCCIAASWPSRHLLNQPPAPATNPNKQRTAKRKRYNLYSFFFGNIAAPRKSGPSRAKMRENERPLLVRDLRVFGASMKWQVFWTQTHYRPVHQGARLPT